MYRISLHILTASIYTTFDSIVGKPKVPPFQNLNQIENPLNIKKVISKNAMYVNAVDANLYKL